ncbi:DUF3244 domain-containing protein [Phocaeicola sartorii]|jgi:hypothetical protein|uniref:DUF3244 domain-containing protein n=1 Tax=Phocaeicola sartorii TaxID=671267 RepID=UPI00242A75ED|nr:DUF3244 domain-containing protein [Phocaeicola sartorii]
MMKTKRLIVILCCLVQVLFGTVAYAEKIPVNKNWKEADGERSLSSSPILMKEGNMLLIQSDKVLENLFIAITSEDGRQVYLELSNVTVDTAYVIPIDLLPAGNYCITVMQGANYVIGYFHVG